MSARPRKITFAELRASGVRGLLVYCSDYHCSHYIALSGDRWPDDVRLSDLEPRFVCSACGRRGADVRPDFHWDKPGALAGVFLRNVQSGAPFSASAA
jgi:GT2 family glycosyltransferase